MLHFLRNRQKEEETSYRVIFLKEYGTQPFKEVDFSKYNVFQINDFTLMKFDDISNFYKKLVDTPAYFEVWTVPTILNPKLSLLHSIEELSDKKNQQLQTYLDTLAKTIRDYDYDRKVNNSYLVVNKKQSEIVIEKFKQLSLNLRSINEKEAMVITVLKEQY